MELLTDPAPTVVFDEKSPNWVSEPEYNQIFLKAVQNHMNSRLRIKGHVFLNEILDSLGIARTRDGALGGWVLDKEGSGFIDFGIEEGEAPGSLVIQFNPDGPIYDLI